MPDQTTHKSELKRLAALTESAELGGGAKAIEKRHALGKLTARERLNLLFDPHTFVEMNQLAESQAVDFGMQQKKVPGDGVVIGYGAVEERLVFAYAQDATVLGGSVGTVHGQKICRIIDEALKVKAPIVGLFDSGGGRIHEGFFASKGVAGMFYRNTAASGVIPQISAMMGPCAGVSVYSPALTDFIIMVEGTSQMAITGPGVIKSVTGENVTLEELGGAKVHSEITGQAHMVAKTDTDCLRSIRSLLAYLPSNNEESPPAVESNDDPFRTDPSLEDIVPADFRKAYDMREVIARVVDQGTFHEL
ncbi:MAG: methylmalonyl-CoA carboxyltransferase, partial [Deltaproteobacteria bacterium]|nr:methylmalonyl-CoA carboxyltransferase [Deltaproteobacteria bacterium]